MLNGEKQRLRKGILLPTDLFHSSTTYVDLAREIILQNVVQPPTLTNGVIIAERIGNHETRDCYYRPILELENRVEQPRIETPNPGERARPIFGSHHLFREPQE